MPIESIPCKFCGGSAESFVQASENMFGLGGSFTYQICGECASVQISEIPENLASFYPQDYYSFVPLKKSNPFLKLLKKIRLGLFLSTGFAPIAPNYGYWLRKVNPGLRARIADVGCGNGQLLYELHCAGYEDLHGFDPFMEQSIQVEHGLDLWKMRIEDSLLDFDLILMHHAFEHMEDPHAVLLSCWKKLKPGGTLLIRCPVADAQVWKEKRQFWVQLDAPRHLIIPTVEGLSLLAKQIGLEVQEVEFDSTAFQFWATSLYEKGISLRSGNVTDHFSPAELKELNKKALRYNLEGKGDQTCFYLRKPIKS